MTFIWTKILGHLTITSTVTSNSKYGVSMAAGTRSAKGTAAWLGLGLVTLKIIYFLYVVK